MITIACDGSGDFKTINDALAVVPQVKDDRIVLFVKNGVYKEKIRLMHANLSLIGEDAEKTVITFDDCAKKLLPDGRRMGTFNSYTVYIGGSDFHASNITIENSAGNGCIAGQAVALYVDADRASFKNCRIIGWQDTLFTGPLPDDPVPAGINPMHPYAGLGDWKVAENFRHYFEECFIQGDIDFIFGSSTAVFNRCTVFSNDIRSEHVGYITAASTPSDAAFGYVFIDCTVTSKGSIPTSYLGRPWRTNAKTAFVNCHLGGHVFPEGWHDWNKSNAQQSVQYAEYGNNGPGADNKKRPGWIKFISDQDFEQYNIANILAGNDGWNPLEC